MTAALEALATVLPNAERTLLLRACLRDDADAWERWRARTGGLSAALREGRAPRGLAPLLHDAVRRAGLPADPSTLTLLRTAAVREELRAGAVERAAAQVVTALAAVGIEPVVTGGPALAATAYESPALRHRHDLDLLVGEQELERAAAALGNGSELRVRLHTQLVGRRGFGEPPAPRTRRFDFGGARACTLAREELLLHVCVRAVCRAQPAALVWAADAWQLLARAPGLDWQRLLATATASRTELPLAAALRYLARELDAPVPPQVLGELVAAAGRADAPARDAARALARQARRRGPLRRRLAFLSRPLAARGA